MKINLTDVEGVVLKMANGAAVLYPPATPILAVIGYLIRLANTQGIVPHEIPAEQVAAMASWIAAKKASDLTSERARKRLIECPYCLGTFSEEAK